MIDDILEATFNPSDDEKLQYSEDWNKFQQKMREMNSNAKKTVKRLRSIADRLDEAWWEYKMSYATGTFGCVVGGALTLTTESIYAKAFGIAGFLINYIASSIDYTKHSEDNKVAEKLLKETRDNFIAVRKEIHLWIARKEYFRITYIYGQAIAHKVATSQVLMFLRECIFDSKEIPPMVKNMATLIEKRVWNSGAKAPFQGVAEGAAKNGAQVADDAVQASSKTIIENLAKNGAQVSDDAVLVSAETSAQEVVKKGAQVSDDAVQASAKASTQKMVKNGAQFADDVVQAGAKASTQEMVENAAQLADDVIQASKQKMANGKWQSLFYDAIQNNAKASRQEMVENAAQLADDVIQASKQKMANGKWQSLFYDAIQNNAKASTQEMIENAAQFADDVIQAGAKTSTKEMAKNGAQLADDAIQAAAKASTQEVAKKGAKFADDAIQAGAKASTQGVAKNGAQVADDVAEASLKTAGNFQKLIAVMDTGLLLMDTKELVFTIKDLVRNKGSDAAKDLREKAEEIEDAFIQ